MKTLSRSDVPDKNPSLPPQAPPLPPFALPAGEPAQVPVAAPRRFRTIWISDVHLGTRGCKAEFLLDFLRHTESETLYLVGDIVDAWQLRKSWYWPETHDEVIRAVLRKARTGTRVVYVPGNHDEFLRNYGEVDFAGVRLRLERVHRAADGRRYLIIHGDAFDGVVTHHRWLALVGHRAYQAAVRLNTLFNYARRKLGYPYWSLSAYLKHRVKNAVGVISSFETTLAAEARQRGLDGVICGHIHRAEIRLVDGLLYANDGDWVESCTALVEHDDGALELLRWTEERNLDPHEAHACAS